MLAEELLYSFRPWFDVGLHFDLTISIVICILRGHALCCEILDDPGLSTQTTHIPSLPKLAPYDNAVKQKITTKILYKKSSNL
jgi:hypothetical protein